MMLIIDNKKCLVHHGIEGQKWGVRNGPPYPLEGGISKGTKLSSVSVWKNAKDYVNLGRALYTYNPNDDWDSSVYKGPFAKYKSSPTFFDKKKKKIYETQFEVVKDLKMPTKKERVDEFINLYKNKKLQVSEDLESAQLSLREWNAHMTDKKALDINMRDLKTDKDYKMAYEVFNKAMENVENFKSTKEYLNIMSTKYDAMVDDNDQGIYNGAHDPVIIFKANEALKVIGNVKVSDKDIKSYEQKVKDKLISEGKHITY